MPLRQSKQTQSTEAHEERATYVNVLLEVAQIHALPVAAVVGECLPVATDERAAAQTPHVEKRENPASSYLLELLVFKLEIAN